MARDNENDWAANFFLSYISYWIGCWVDGPGTGFGYINHFYFYWDLNFWYCLFGYPTIWFDVMRGLDLLPADVKSLDTTF